MSLRWTVVATLFPWSFNGLCLVPVTISGDGEVEGGALMDCQGSEDQRRFIAGSTSMYVGAVLSIFLVSYKGHFYLKSPRSWPAVWWSWSTWQDHGQYNSALCHQERGGGISLVVQWLRTCLAVQGTLVWFLLQEDLKCCRATKAMRHSYWACVP